jgi:hypothetical protein
LWMAAYDEATLLGIVLDAGSGGSRIATCEHLPGCWRHPFALGKAACGRSDNGNNGNPRSEHDGSPVATLIDLSMGAAVHHSEAYRLEAHEPAGVQHKGGSMSTRPKLFVFPMPTMYHAPLGPDEEVGIAEHRCSAGVSFPWQTTSKLRSRLSLHRQSRPSETRSPTKTQWSRRPAIRKKIVRCATRCHRAPIGRGPELFLS